MQRYKGLGLGVSAAAWLCLSAGTLAAGSDFTFKRIGPPPTGAKRLISIHVEPPAPVSPVLSHAPDVPPEVPPVVATKEAPGIGATYHWFWAQVSPALAKAGRGKLRMASAALAGNRSASAQLEPSFDRLTDILKRYSDEIYTATKGRRVSPALVLAVITVESNGRSNAKSSAGAVGLMQLMPATAERFGVSDRTDPMQNILGGVKYLDFLLSEFRGDAVLALAAYNAGEGAVTRNAGVPDYKETRAYVPKVVAAWQQARRLCLLPPETATDACLFSGVKLAAQ